MPSFKLGKEESDCSVREPLWRLLVVTDAGSGIAQHKIYKPTEISSAPGYDPSGSGPRAPIPDCCKPALWA